LFPIDKISCLDLCEWPIIYVRQANYNIHLWPCGMFILELKNILCYQKWHWFNSYTYFFVFPFLFLQYTKTSMHAFIHDIYTYVQYISECMGGGVGMGLCGCVRVQYIPSSTPLSNCGLFQYLLSHYSSDDTSFSHPPFNACLYSSQHLSSQVFPLLFFSLYPLFLYLLAILL
jgi:hypothetical protein